MAEKVGVYICHCGSNIAGTVDCEAVAKWAGENVADVAVARDYKFMCSSLGQAMIEEDIKTKGLTRVVVAACSPHLHEKTFRRACTNAGLNPYLFQMCNIREHVSWVHTDKAAATEKAKSLVSAAVHRVKMQEPLEAMRVPVNKATLVVGGGIAGLQATLELADAGYPVYLVEREPSIGGHMAQFDKTFPTLDCSACILTPKMSEAGQHENVTLITYAELEEVSGSVGNFKVKIRKRAKSIIEDKCTGCGACVEKCPRKVVDTEFEAGLGYRKAIYMPFPQAVPKVPVIDRENCTFFKTGKCKVCEKMCQPGAIDYTQQDEIIEIEVGNIILATGWKLFDCRKIPQYGYGRLANVYTSMEFERLCNAAGPTNGKIVLRDGKTEPKSVAIVHCVGSRDKNHNEYCSGICCMAALKFGHLVMEKTGAEVYSFYIDMRTNQKMYEEFYGRLLEEGMHFVRGKVAEITDAARQPSEQGKLIVQVEDTLMGKQRRIPVDMVILMGALEPQADAKELGLKCGISCSMAGWYTERHPKLDPVATMTDGVFVAGACQGAKDIPASVAQGAAAAARVMGMITKGSVEIEPVVASIDEEQCSGCRICNNMCPYNAIDYIEAEAVSRINTAMCKGCGTCVAACPAGAISGSHFTDRQIFAEIEGVLWDAKNGAGVTVG
ncbi:MAG TPA: CoB--CoM heterodisulfide reductase iron-sulfur subunit A family protein [Phycisphaerae bacterium]|nr:CoB--CoM heterodisulfide reductase iron-sulfur subunit A family protein [Phycisphaerae bacterium]HOJ75914.1 CoB--CoM heterodisulfide reductase iron-sulfur subunit A family protein [Phycisphaerae bacterium]HOM52310.1 CoB--CoM heterodisulfide reductase iron-sulfur subunit A family protein [Phycisphaerae bacterium]HOQ84634.1 CoB--CoM heterodisulfide reductase iron-sulfur subunit A family protein [Phycisphaerae bacterium]HPP24906.1 CoB--CoM heterodisulfide reductase iron-sulfur subunit A family 